MRIVVGLYGLFDARNEALSLGAADICQHYGNVAIPAAVDRPVVHAHWIAPANDVITSPADFIGALQHDPAVHRKNAFPGARRTSEHDDTGGLKVACRGQHPRTRPVGLPP